MMLICQVVGTVVATAKVDSFRGTKLLLVQEQDDGQPVGRPFVAVDGAGAGTGETVLVAQGSVARDAGVVPGPTDAAVVAIVDSVENGNLSPSARRALEESKAPS